MAIIISTVVPAICLPTVRLARASDAENVLDGEFGVVSFALGFRDVCFEVLELRTRFVNCGRDIVSNAPS